MEVLKVGSLDEARGFNGSCWRGTGERVTGERKRDDVLDKQGKVE